MRTTITYVFMWMLAGTATSHASDLKPALETFARYEYGQAKQGLHETRMAAFRGTDKAQIRRKNEDLLIAFILSDASLDARREACFWLSDIGTEKSRPMLTSLLMDDDLADAVRFALDGLSKSGAVAPSTHDLAQFTSEVASSDDPAAVLISGIQGKDDALARQAFRLLSADDVHQEVLQWLVAHTPSLPPARQVVAMNRLLQLGVRECIPVLETLSSEGQGVVALAAIRLRGSLGRSTDAAYLVKLFCSGEAPETTAALRALRALPLASLKHPLLVTLNSPDPSIQAKAIQIAELCGGAASAGALWTIAETDDTPNRASAIKALSRTAPPSDYQRLIKRCVSQVNDTHQKQWMSAAWNMSRRHPDYNKAVSILETLQKGAPAETAQTLSVFAGKLRSMMTSPDTRPPEQTQKPPAQPKVLLPGPYSDVIPQRFEQAAYLNCGPKTKAAQDGVTLNCLNGTPWNAAPNTDPSLSVLFSAETLEFEITGLAPDAEYVLGSTWWDSTLHGRRQAIFLNGQEVLPDTRAIGYDEPGGKAGLGKPTPVRIQFSLLPEHIQNGVCKVSVRKLHGPNTVTSEVWVAKRVRPRAEKQVLLISGQDYPGHHWRKTGPVMESIIVADTRIEVTPCETPYVLGLAHLDAYDAVFIHFKNYDHSLPSTRQIQANLKQYVLNGGGMCMSHFACGAFMEWPEFVDLSGRIWSGGGHDPRGPFTVKVIDPEHPITQGLGDHFETDDELYWCLKGTPEIHTLCNAMSKSKKVNHPQALVLEPGKGRTFLCTLGHDAKAYASDSVKQLYRQGAAWAAGL